MKDILIKVVNQELIRQDKDKIIAKTHNYIRLKFQFSREWEEAVKYAIITTSSGDSYEYVLENESIVLSEDIMMGKFFKVSCYGIFTDGSRITTSVKSIILLESGYTANASSEGYIEAMIDNINEQLLSKIDNITYNDDRLQAWSGEELICSIPISISWDNIQGKPDVFPPEAHTHEASNILDMEDSVDTILNNFLDVFIERLDE